MLSKTFSSKRIISKILIYSKASPKINSTKGLQKEQVNEQGTLQYHWKTKTRSIDYGRTNLYQGKGRIYGSTSSKLVF